MFIFHSALYNRIYYTSSAPYVIKQFEYVKSSSAIKIIHSNTREDFWHFFYLILQPLKIESIVEWLAVFITAWSKDLRKTQHIRNDRDSNSECLRKSRSINKELANEIWSKFREEIKNGILTVEAGKDIRTWRRLPTGHRKPPHSFNTKNILRKLLSINTALYGRACGTGSAECTGS